MMLEKYCYDELMEDKYRIIREKVNGRRYRTRHFNGFMQLLLEPHAEAYFICQASHEYALPDWKFHVSVQLKDYKKTWDILVQIFAEYDLLGMKMQVQPTWSKFGRGFTIYIFTTHSVYTDFPITYQWEPHGEVLETDFKRFNNYSDKDWWIVFKQIERRLREANIQPAGFEEGEFALGKYVSLRNESFCLRLTENHLKRSEDDGKPKLVPKMVYPPDNCGWNPRGHGNFPMDTREEVVWNFDYLKSKIGDDPLFEIPRVKIPQAQSTSRHFESVMRSLTRRVGVKRITNPKVIEGIVISLAMVSFYSPKKKIRNLAVKYLIWEMFCNKKRWKKKMCRPFVLEYLEKIRKYNKNKDTVKYLKKQWKEMMKKKKYEDKKGFLKSSHARRILNEWELLE